MQKLAGTDCANVFERRVVATHHQVLAVIQRVAGRGVGVRAGAAPGILPSFEEGEVAKPVLRQPNGCRKAADARANNRYF